MASPSAYHRASPAWRLPVIIAVTIAARLATAGSPLVHVDEAFYLTVADAMRHGAIPYVDVWDRKPVGLFLLYLPAAFLGMPASIYAYQAMAAAAVVATGWLIARLAERAGWTAGALPAAIFYILWLNLAGGQGGQTPVFYNAAMAGAALLCLSARRRDGVAAMLLVGLAIQVKYTVVFEGAGFGLWLLWRDRCRGASIGALAGYAALLIVVALAPTLVAIGVYAAIGQIDAFFFANVYSIFRRGGDAPGLVATHLADAAAILTPLAFAVANWKARPVEPHEREAAWFVRAWLVIALIAFIGFGNWYNHYALPVMLPGAVCAAAFFARRERSLAWVALPLALLFVAGQAIIRSQATKHGDAAQFWSLVNRVGHGSGALFVYSGPVLLYPASGRPALTRYLFPSHLEFTREAGAIGADQRVELARIMAHRPAVIVMGPAILEEDPSLRAWLLATLARGGYRATSPVLLGRDPLIVYRLASTS